jgi:8-amino-7-oxononanoate synthase
MAMDLFEKTRQFTIAREAMKQGIYPFFTALDESEGTEVVVDGHRLIMIGSNNYLGLTSHPKVRQAAIEAIERFGPSCTGSRFLNGNLKMHLELERRLAAYVGKQAALVFSTGFQTNLGTISSLVQKGDVVIIDKEDHASIVDGCKLAWGKMLRYPHNDMDGLERQLKSVPDDVGKLVVVDGVFSMGGDIALLPQIAELCKKYGARLMVDDAHSLGVLAGGRGTAAHFGLTSEVDLIMGTFSKSFASLGGFIAGDEEVIHYIQHTARPFMFSASATPAMTAAAMAALEVMETEPEHCKRLWANSEHMRAGLKAAGFDTGASVTPVIPLMMGDDMRVLLFYKLVYEGGAYINCVLAPAVPEGQQLVRTSYMATHTTEQLDRALAILTNAGRTIGIIPDPETMA